MDAHEPTRIQVLSVSDTGRRRWTDDEKFRIIEASYGDGASLSKVARRHKASRSQLYDWRYRHKHGLLGSAPQFLRVLPLEDASGGSADEPAPPAPLPVLAIMILIVPVLAPTLMSAGIDPVHFGVVFIFNLMIGLMTPPMGVGLFVVLGIRLETLIRATIPFLVPLVIVLAALILFPALVTWLPNLLLGAPYVTAARV